MGGRCLRLAFAGTPEASAKVLETLINADRHRVEQVITTPDRAAGRGRRMRASKVKLCAEKHQLPLIEAACPRDIPTAILRELDLLIVVAYGMILPTEILAAPRWGGLNLHFSLLPRWRGAAPVPRTILEGDRESGISFMRMEAGLDTGAIYQQVTCPLSGRESSEELLTRLADLGGAKLLECLDRFASGNAPEPKPQRGPSCYAAKISTEETWLDWQQDAQVIDRMIRAFNPTPGARTSWGSHILQIWEATPETIATRPAHRPGEILYCGTEGIVVAAASGAVRIRYLQAAGRRILAVRDFINGLANLSTLQALPFGSKVPH